MTSVADDAHDGPSDGLADEPADEPLKQHPEPGEMPSDTDVQAERPPEDEGASNAGTD